MSDKTDITPDHASRGHHPQGPSQLKALRQCSGFENQPGTGPAAEMGTRIHEALEVRDPEHLTSELEVNIYEACVRAEDRLIAEYFGDDPYDRFNEQELVVPLNSGLEIWGTGDVTCISRDGTRGLQIDYKTGRMRVDDAEVNWQAKAYKNGAFEKYPSLETVRFIFLAPQLNSINWYDFNRESVPMDRQHITEIVANAQAAREKWALGTITARDVTPCDQCTWCRHQTYCPGIHGVLARVCENAGFPIPDLSGLTDDPSVLAQRYTVAKLLEPLIEKFKKEAVAAAQEGEALPGWELRNMGAKSIATDNKLFAEYAISHGVSLDEILDRVNIPVAQIRDLVKDRAQRGAKKAVAEKFVRDALDTGIIKKGAERFTLVAEKLD